MWTVMTQFSKPNAESASKELEWSAVAVETAAEAEAWWKTRTASRSAARCVRTLTNPQGEIVRVQFN